MTQDLPETMQSQQRLVEGHVVNMRRDTITMRNGKQATREVLEHPGGVVVLPVLPDGRLIFVSQYRYAIQQYLLELPAGKLEKGEKPEAAVHRELLEETGYKAGTMTPLSHIYTAPGFCDEKLWLYLAETLSYVEEPQGDGEEEIELMFLTPQEALQQAQQGHIMDAKTMSLLLLYPLVRPQIASTYFTI